MRESVITKECLGFNMFVNLDKPTIAHVYINRAGNEGSTHYKPGVYSHARLIKLSTRMLASTWWRCRPFVGQNCIGFVIERLVIRYD